MSDQAVGTAESQARIQTIAHRIELAENIYRDNPQEKTYDQLQQAVGHLSGPDALSVMKEVSQFDHDNYQRSLVKVENGQLIVPPISALQKADPNDTNKSQDKSVTNKVKDQPAQTPSQDPTPIESPETKGRSGGPSK